MTKEYLFTSPRLGFRNWLDTDLEPMSKLNADAVVMEYFPRTQTKEETAIFIGRMQRQFETDCFCYFAVDEMGSGDFVGFIGMSKQTYEADFTPCVDIGWRLDQKFWGRGLATEGASRCLKYAENDLGISKIYSIASVINVNSISVMKKIGMKYVRTFEHSLLMDFDTLKSCVLYEYELKGK